MKAEEIMTRNVIFCKNNETILDAIKKLDEHNISGLPVIDEKGKLVGIFSRTDAIKILSKKKAEKLKNTTLKDFLKRRRKLIFSKKDESIEKIAKIMYSKKIDRVPIVDNNMKVIGIISKTDIIKVLASSLEKREEAKISSLLDKIMEILEKENKISIKELAKRLQIDEGSLEKIVSILEKNKIVEVSYSVTGIWIKKK
ncbi:MAG: CBS domain-containing protein [Candidatus Aenigmatarchaeota archaeon]